MAIRLIPNRPFEFPDKPPTIKSWTAYKKAFGSRMPTPEQITELQKSWASVYAVNKSKTLKSLNEDFFTEINDSDWILEINKKINNIEGNLNNLKKSYDISTVAQLENNLNNLTIQWKLIHNRLSNYQNTSTIGVALDQLQNNIDNLRNLLSNYNKTDSLDSLRTFNTKGEEVSLLKQLQGISTALKGFELEASATEEINKRLIEKEGTKSSKKALQTGNILFKGTGGKSVSIKEDISLIDEAFLQAEVTLRNGETITIEELIKRCEKDEKIVLTAESYEELQGYIITGISAKTTAIGSDIVFHSGISWNWLKSNGASNNEFYWRLYHYVQLSGQYMRFKSPQGQVEMLADYVMSSALNKIIGIKNNLLLTRRGYEWTEDYLNNITKDTRLYIDGLSKIQKANDMGTHSVRGPNK